MAAKKAKSSSDKQLRAIVKKLEAKLERAEARTARWRKKAKQHEAAAASSKARVTKLEKRLAKATKAASQPHVSRGPVKSAVVSTKGAEPTKPPDASWTVVELRAEARSRGLTGMSRKSKAEIIAALT